VLDYARRNNVTQIVVGKSHRKGWRAWFRRSLAPELLKAQNGAALHIVTEVVSGPAQRQAKPASRGRRNWLSHLGANAMVVVAIGLAEL
ncbi:hypothetical protein ACTAK1_28685, partial [Klebsiella pneumoniae]|uniref:hypothetical protein n=1 Tax=Klebsiella pneumoniae TaxID=573 RepID=UPI003F47FBC2